MLLFYGFEEEGILAISVENSVLLLFIWYNKRDYAVEPVRLGWLGKLT